MRMRGKSGILLLNLPLEVYNERKKELEHQSKYEKCQSNAFGHCSQSSAFGQLCQSSAYGQQIQSNATGQPTQSIAYGQLCQSSAYGQKTQSNSEQAFGASTHSRVRSKGLEVTAGGPRPHTSGLKTGQWCTLPSENKKYEERPKGPYNNLPDYYCDERLKRGFKDKPMNITNTTAHYLPTPAKTKQNKTNSKGERYDLIKKLHKKHPQTTQVPTRNIHRICQNYNTEHKRKNKAKFPPKHENKYK